MSLIRYLPLSYISWFLGLLANLPLPQPLAEWTIRVFAWFYGIDHTTATRPVNEFRSIGEFFTRDLRPEERPLGDRFICPVDGKLRSYHELSPGMLISQVKGRDYSLEQLLAGDSFTSRLERGALWNMYLSPSDAHHIFAPAGGMIVRTVHIPGKLWPVNDWALNSVDYLFAVNERVVTFIETQDGLVAVVMIGATNVGRIALHYAPLETNMRPWEPKSVKVVDHPSIPVVAGDKLGTFKMGSSVIVIAENLRPSSAALRDSRSVKYGEQL
ncbi:MAG: archaetidylserine decarboxylase [Pseudomonadota bacterium]|jgi:phosphatidylserine decarboxylase